MKTLIWYNCTKTNISMIYNQLLIKKGGLNEFGSNQ